MKAPKPRQQGGVTGDLASPQGISRIPIEEREAATVRLAGDSGGPYLEVSKGVHIVVPDQRLSAAFLLLHPSDGRVFFVLPWHGKTLIGTTDTFDTHNPDHLAVRPDELDYLLAGFNRYFSQPYSSCDVLSHFAGLRPLLRAGSGAASPPERTRSAKRRRWSRWLPTPSRLPSSLSCAWASAQERPHLPTPSPRRRARVWLQVQRRRAGVGLWLAQARPHPRRAQKAARDRAQPAAPLPTRRGGEGASAQAARRSGRALRGRWRGGGAS